MCVCGVGGGMWGGVGRCGEVYVCGCGCMIGEDLIIVG